MDEKLPGVVQKITLNTNTYQNRSIEPTLINFFFGKNGAGKSTIAQCFKGKREGLFPDVSAYEVLVYNQDFIRENLQEDRSMPGVFSMNAEDIEKQNQISAKQEELDKLREQYTTKKNTKEEKENFPASLRSDLEGSFWKLTATPRADFPKAVKAKISNRITKATVCDQLLTNITAKETNLNELHRLYDIAFGSDSTTYTELKKPQLLAEDKIDGFDLLNEKIISSSDKEYAKFIQRIGATDWLRRSHDTYAHKTDGKCPYCMKKLDDDFEEQFSACFDEHYRRDIQKLQDFISEYEQKTTALITLLQNNKLGAFPQINFSAYDDKVGALATTIKLNKEHLADKAETPGAVKSIEPLDDKITEIAALIDGFNQDIKSYNEIVKSRATKQTECVTAVWQHMAFLVKSAKTDYIKKMHANKNETDALNAELKTLTDKGKALSHEITNLAKEIKGIDSTMLAINKTLSDSGFQGFHLRKKGNKDEDKSRYVIVRDDNSPAHGLSEGEKNFIAFLYFYHKVWGRESADAIFKDRIVVIDDPVSSMDSSSLFIVSTIIRELIGICYNNGYPARADAKRFIRQMFILTHNAYFLHGISYDRIKQWECVNFYLVKKTNNISEVICCTKHNPHAKEPTIPHNYNPVQNSYAALWHEYGEVKSAIALKRVMRHILDYYFLQISGFEGHVLRERIFKDETVFNDADGNRDEELVQSINALLQYVGSDTQGFNAGFDYVEDTEDIQSLKSTFEKVFEIMGQDQHYRMMMETVRS